MTNFRIVDVCGTLVVDDTTIGLLKWHFARSGRWRYWYLKACTAQWSPLRIVFSIAERLAGKHFLKYMLVRRLKGDSEVDLAKSAGDYTEWLLFNRSVTSVADVLANTSGPVVLASASLEPVVQAIATRMGALFVASTLEVEHGRYTGRYAKDISGNKIAALGEILGYGWEGTSYIAISDNLSDRSLLQGAHPAYVVLRRSRHRAYWANINPVYLSQC